MKREANKGTPSLIWKGESEPPTVMEQGLPFLPGDGRPGEASTPFFPHPFSRKQHPTECPGFSVLLTARSSGPTTLTLAADTRSGLPGPRQGSLA